MRSAREVVVAVVVTSLELASRPAAADDGGLNIAKADIATLEVGAGAIGTPNSPPPPDGAVSPDLTGGFLGARVEFLGLFVEAVTFRASYQPVIGNGALSGTVADLEAWMIGSHYPDEPVCMAAVSLCDEDTGYVGFGATVLEMQGDTIDERLGMRVVQGTFVGSVTPAFAPSWREYRLLPHIGASFDIVRDIPQDENTYLGRGVLGLDAKATAGPVAFTASFDWRPNFTEFVDDFILETRVGVDWRTHWHGWHDRDALTVSLELAHSHDSVPKTAFGPDRLPDAVDSLMARVVVAPAIFTIGPP